MRDLEFGVQVWRDQYKNVIKNVNKYKMYKKQILLSFLFITFAIGIKFGMSNIDRVVQTGSAITLEEQPYKSFKLGSLITTKVETSEHFDIKDSLVNRKMQKVNVEIASDEAKTFLKDSGNICIHLKQFGVKWDIMVFENVTVINPQIISEGTSRKNIPQIGLDGSQSWASRPTNIYIKHYNEKLEYVYTHLWDNQAFCFAYYQM